MGSHGGRRSSASDPVVTEGPPKPEALDTIVQLADSQRLPYEALYTGLMDSTQAARDSLHAARQALREAFGSQDRATIQEQMRTVQALTRVLEDRQKKFDEALKKLLDKDQWKRYDKWREEQRQEAAALRRGTGEPGGPRS